MSYDRNVVNSVVHSSSMSRDKTADLLCNYRLGHVPFVMVKKITSIPVQFSPHNLSFVQFAPWQGNLDYPFLIKQLPQLNVLI